MYSLTINKQLNKFRNNSCKTNSFINISSRISPLNPRWNSWSPACSWACWRARWPTTPTRTSGTTWISTRSSLQTASSTSMWSACWTRDAARPTPRPWRTPCPTRSRMTAASVLKSRRKAPLRYELLFGYHLNSSYFFLNYHNQSKAFEKWLNWCKMTQCKFRLILLLASKKLISLL